MNRIEKMQEASVGLSVKFTEITRAYAKDKSQMICIFEGEDEKYFCARLTQSLQERSWCPINTGGKAIVLGLFDTLIKHPTYQSVNFRCFIDSDFEDWFSNPDPERVYITPCYSIENLYVSENVFKRIISAEFEVGEYIDDGQDYAKCIELFNNRLTEYIKCVEAFNHWVKAQRIMVRDGKSPKKISIRHIKLNQLVDVKIDSVKPTYNPNDRESLFSGDRKLDIDMDSLSEAKSTLPLEMGVKKFRGKQNLDFLRSLLVILKNDRTSKNPEFFSSHKNVRLQLSKENIISELSQYAETPKCLISFLQ